MRGFLLKCIFLNMRRNKKRVAIDVLSLFFCVVFLITLATAFFGFRQSVKKYESQKNGTQDVIYNNISDGEYDNLLKNGAFERVGKASIIGFFEPSADFDDALAVGLLDGNALSLAAIEISDGSLPSKSGEALLERGVLYKMNLNLGDFLNVKLKTADGEEIPLKVKIVGVCNDYSASQSQSADIENKERMLPSVMIFEDDLKAIKAAHGSFISCFAKLSKSAETADFDNLFLKITGRENVDFCTSHGFSGESQIESFSEDSEKSFTYIFAALVCFSAFVLFFGLLVSAENGKSALKGEIRLLKLSLANSAFIKKFIFGEFLIKYFAALIFAIVISAVVLPPVFSSLFKDFFEVVLFHISAWYCVFSAAFVFAVYGATLLLISFRLMKKRPLDGGASLQKITAAQNRSFNNKNPVSLFAKKCRLKDKKRLAVSAALLALSFAVALGSISLSDALIRDLKEEHSYDYRIFVKNEAKISYFSVPAKLFCGIGDSDVKKLESLSSAPEVAAFKTVSFRLVTTEPKKYGKSALFYEAPTDEEYEFFKRDKAALGFSDGEYVSQTDLNVTGINSDMLSQLKACVTAGEIDENAFCKENAVIKIKNAPSQYDFKIGETFSASASEVFTPLDSYMKSGIFKAARHDILFKVVAEVDISRINDVFLRESTAFSSQYVTLNDVLSQNGLNAKNNDVFIRLSNPDSSNEAEEILKEIKNIHPEVSLVSKRSEARRLELMVGMTKAVCGLITAISFCVAVLNVYSCTKKRLLEEARSLMLLRAIGFDFKMAALSQCAVLLPTAFGSLIFGAAAGFAINAFFNRSAVFSSFPWLGFVGEILVAAAAVTAVTLATLRPYYKKSIIETLGSQE